MLVLEARDRVGGAAETERAGPGRPRADARPHRRAAAAVASPASSSSRSHGLALVAPEVRVFAPQPDGRAVTLWARPRHAPRTPLRAVVRRRRDARSWSSTASVRSLARFLADLGDEAPPDIRAPGFGDALLGLRLGRAFRGLGQATTGATILRVARDGGRRLRRRVVRDRARSAGDRWPGAASGTRRWARGRRGTTAGAARRCRGQRRRRRGRDRVRQGRPRRAGRGAGRRRPARRAPRSGPAREVVAVTSVDGAATGVALDSGEEIRRRASSSRRRPEAAC